MRLFTIVLVTLWAGLAQAQAFDTRATAAYVLDQNTGTVMLYKNATQPLPPASMSKLMTLFMTFEALRDGRLSIDERLPVSQHAMNYGGSTMFLDTTDRVTVEDLIRGIIVLSGNDASAVLAEALSPDGTEAGFARLMTARAQELGMTASTFQNSNGMPAAGHRMSMRDLVILTDRLIKDFPTYYPLFNEREFAFDGRAPSNTRNRNPILGLGIGADGLKTGHTREAGYGLVGSARQGDRRIIFAITGLETQQARAEESERIVNWAFRQFAERQVAEGGTQLAAASVFMGEATEVGVALEEDFSILIPAIGDAPQATFVYDGPLEAPITAGDRVGQLIVTHPAFSETRLPLVATEDVARGGFVPRIRAAADALLRQVADAG
ncbi:MAG: D-alanyl-D-alanine carboxypeptidase family protein [Shimia sp.]